MTFTASDVLLKAASRIEEEGMWCQKSFYKLPQDRIGILENLDHMASPTLFDWGQLVQQTGLRVPECAQAALMSAAIELDNASLYAEARRRLDCVVGEIISFNDAPDRTPAEVAEAMRRAAQ